jgi:pyruvate dehydrogenase E1 component alpha subunit
LGQEGIATGFALKEGDYIASTHRGHGHCIAWGGHQAHGCQLLQSRLLPRLWRLDAYCRYCRQSRREQHCRCRTPLGGAALTAQIRGSDAVTVTFTTDGASNSGTFLESLNLAAIWNLNFILVIENNQYAVSAHRGETREVDLYKRGLAWRGSAGRRQRPARVYDLTQEAAEKCRAGKGRSDRSQDFFGTWAIM